MTYLQLKIQLRYGKLGSKLCGGIGLITQIVLMFHTGEDFQQQQIYTGDQVQAYSNPEYVSDISPLGRFIFI